ncbi:hypothetical protein ACFB49_08410 [Sphingomonas sp. DBB INV C78]|uniref:hypothetical protein n=1 Tax=Sphingomonas sp. DBB INV C78 TaxID=3349434 RepID=UPI0036D3F775
MQFKIIVATLAVALGSTSAFAQSAPVAQSDAPANSALKDADVETAAVAASGANSFTEEQARDRIAKGGFTDISGLTKDDNGLWQGMAKKHGKSVHIALDYKGNIVTK